MPLEVTNIDGSAMPKPKTATAAVLKKFTTLGAVRFPVWVQPLPNGAWAGLVEAEGNARPALLGPKDKAARFIEELPPGKYRFPSVRADGKGAVYCEAFGEGNGSCRLHLLDAETGATTLLYEGPNPQSFALVAGGLLLFPREGQLTLVEPDGHEGKVMGSRPFEGATGALAAVQGGQVVLGCADKPHELVAFGVYPGQADPLRRIAATPHRFGASGFVEADGRILFVAAKEPCELKGVAAAYEEGRAGEAVEKKAAPSELVFQFVELSVTTDPDRIKRLPALNYVHDDILPCRGPSWVTRVEHSRKHNVVTCIDDASLAVKSAELPADAYGSIRVDDAGGRAILCGQGPAGVIEVSLPELGVARLGDSLPEADFGPNGRVVTANPGLRLLAPSGEGWKEVSSVPLARVWSFATALDGKVVLADASHGAYPARIIAVFGVYGDTLRLIAKVERPPGVSLYWKRRGARVFASADDRHELLGLAEAYARGESSPSLPLGDLLSSAAPAAPRPATRMTPRLDALVAAICKGKTRGTPPPAHARALAGPLPGDARRLIAAMAEHEHGYVAVGAFSFDENTLATEIPGAKGPRDDLIVLGSDGGGNLYAIDRADAAPEGSILFVDHEDRFADRATSQTLETLLEQLAAGSEGEEGGRRDTTPDFRSPGPAPSGVTRLTCTEGGSSKFWEGKVEGASMTVRWGKLGAEGQSKTKSFPDAGSAIRELEKLVREKKGKGYLEEE